MATYTTTEDVGGLLPADYGPLIVKPVVDAAVAFDVSTYVNTNRHTFHVPVIDEDVSASWVAEGAEIAEDDALFSELIVTPAKVAGLTIISRELADDSTPAAASVVGDSIARSIARQVDAAYFGALAAPAPPGLETLTGVSQLDGGTEWSGTDSFAAAKSLAEAEGATLDAFAAHPSDALALATIKAGADSNVPLFGLDATSPVERRILGVPLYVSRAVTAGTVWGIPAERSIIVLRENVRLDVSRDVEFKTDRVAVRAVMRVGFAFPDPASIVKISLSTTTT